MGSLALFKEIVMVLPLHKKIFSLSAATQKCVQRTNMISSINRTVKGFRHYLRLETECDVHNLCNLYNSRNVTLRVVTLLLKTTYCKKKPPAAKEQTVIHGGDLALCNSSCFPPTPEHVTQCHTVLEDQGFI